LLVIALLVFAGDRVIWAGASDAAALAAFVVIAPLVLGLLGHDYFLSRNEIPAFIPLVTVAAAACVAPRAPALGTAFAIALLIVFSVSTFEVQTHRYLERPDWRDVARALGAADGPRAIYAADGTTADPLKIYMPHVHWVQPQSRPETIDEVDIVGATKRLTLVTGPTQTPTGSGAAPATVGRPVPRSVAPPGSRLIARVRVDNWVVARLALDHPVRVSIHRLIALAPRYFRHTPRSLLLFSRPPASVEGARRPRYFSAGSARGPGRPALGARQPLEPQHHAAAEEQRDRRRRVDEPPL
jgi:hypothetical protein